MAKKVILTADSTCDLGKELEEKFNIATLARLRICYGDESFADGIEIQDKVIFDKFYEDGTLPKTSACSVGDYLDIFTPFIEDGCEVVHISLGSSLSCSYSNAKLAAEQLEGVYVIDSQNLSTGSGLLVAAASDLITEGLSAQEVAEKITALVPHSHASFVIDTLKFLAAGGRCSAMASFGANLLSIKPGIAVNNQNGGSMNVAKKYRGKLDKCIEQYISDQLSEYEHYDRRRAFVTHTSISDEILDLAVNSVKESGLFDEVYETSAGCTISSHCGPNCLGVLFITE